MLDRCVKLICFVRAAAKFAACSITIVWPAFFAICRFIDISLGAGVA